ncbi:MAG: hypothetical protein AAGD11_18710, partial [Planctomycetota bacterium]
EQLPGLVADGKLTVVEEKDIYNVISYTAISDEKLSAEIAKLPAGDQEEVQEKIASITEKSSQGALADMCVFPAVMLVAYVLLGLFFKSRGGYQAESLEEQH